MISENRQPVLPPVPKRSRLGVELAGLAVPAPERYRFGSQEVKPTAFRLDGVLEPPADWPDAPLAFIEVQFQPDDGFYLRFVQKTDAKIRLPVQLHPAVIQRLFRGFAARPCQRGQTQS